jgi:hypothetical protein
MKGVFDLSVQAKFPGSRHGLGAVLHTQLAINVLDVLFHRANRENEPVRDLLVGQPFRHLPQNFLLPLAQCFWQSNKGPGASARSLVSNVIISSG